jgi:hypothetical protein
LYLDNAAYAELGRLAKLWRSSPSEITSSLLRIFTRTPTTPSDAVVLSVLRSNLDDGTQEFLDDYVSAVETLLGELLEDKEAVTALPKKYIVGFAKLRTPQLKVSRGKKGPPATSAGKPTPTKKQNAKP